MTDVTEMADRGDMIAAASIRDIRNMIGRSDMSGRMTS